MIGALGAGIFGLKQISVIRVEDILQETNISQHWKRKIIFKGAFLRNILVPRRIFQNSVFCFSFSYQHLDVYLQSCSVNPQQNNILSICQVVTSISRNQQVDCSCPLVLFAQGQIPKISRFSRRKKTVKNDAHLCTFQMSFKKTHGFSPTVGCWIFPISFDPNTQTQRASSWGSSSSAAIIGTWQQPESPVNQSVLTY